MGRRGIAKKAAVEAEVIESGIPIPGLGGGRLSIMRGLKVGQSVVFEGRAQNIRFDAQYALGAGNYASRKIAPGKLRVWRIK